MILKFFNRNGDSRYCTLMFNYRAEKKRKEDRWYEPAVVSIAMEAVEALISSTSWDNISERRKACS